MLCVEGQLTGALNIPFPSQGLLFLSTLRIRRGTDDLYVPPPPHRTTIQALEIMG